MRKNHVSDFFEACFPWIYYPLVLMYYTIEYIYEEVNHMIVEIRHARIRQQILAILEERLFDISKNIILLKQAELQLSQELKE